MAPTHGMVGDQAVADATGRTWAEWFAWIEQHGGDALDQKSIVRLLDEDAQLANGWWQQQVTVAYEQHAGRRRVGQASDGTYQVGVRRTFRSSPARAWNLVASREGAAAWLGDAPTEWWRGDDGPGKGEVLEAPGGERYQVRGFAAGTRIRLRALGPSLPESTSQLTMTPENGRTVVGLHHEGLPHEELREAMRERWKQALDRIEVLLDAD